MTPTNITVLILCISVIVIVLVICLAIILEDKINGWNYNCLKRELIGLHTKVNCILQIVSDNTKGENENEKE